MVRRSLLFTPGDRPEMMQKAPDSGADVVVFDLEDAVSPERKEEARETVRRVLADPGFDPATEVCVRLNATSSEYQADLEALFGHESERPRLDSVMLPKADSRVAVSELAGTLERYDVSVPVFALIESARGVLAAPDIAAAAATDALVFGAEDLAADIGANRTQEGTEVLYARQRVVLAAAAHDCDAIDTLVTDFEDDRRLAEETEFAIQLGYDGKLAIHPAQIETINDGFAPDDDEIEWANAVLEGKRKADAEGRGVFEVDGEMIDPPLIERARRIRERSRVAREVEDDSRP
ncbi:HpcH/HpaI aldolase/citrate lyase family protein [Natrarchaeobius chitinivorans]|uniref:CoA ester lyase n=1 Tax=Natrarchaeobius chitinivorans TaxID=1679083 RepID=A0A3N6M9I7_NATCH|nr:CoA ester lyase [Natrarchaeobius chitinivorans]RQG97314.1 CoA ester lyase [Natrarchaeobius chitinivorans]